MTLPPPDVCRRIAQLHAMMGSPYDNEANTARDKLLQLLKDCGCRWTDLQDILKEAARANGNGPGKTNTNTPSRPWGDFFHAPDGTAYADIHIDGPRKTWPVRSPAFRDHVRRETFRQTGSPPTNGVLQRIIDESEAEAQFRGPEREVYLRVGQHHGRIYIDLADDQWRVVEVTPNGWRIVKDAPVRFRRTPGMLPLPVPLHGGSVDELADFLNVQSRADFILIVSWLLAALRGVGPFAVLGVWGEQGSAKSMLVLMLRALIDPNVATLRPLPGSERDLFVSADDNYVLPFDNISLLVGTTSDALCRLATGGAYASRRFFRNKGEVAIQAKRPIIISGISCVIDRADLADRAIFIALGHITDDRRRDDTEILAAFEAARPRILGALLDAVSRGLRELPNVMPTELSRMADFDLWGRACEPALWPAGSFQQAYAANRSEAVENSIEADLVATTIKKVVEAHGEWKGTATDLLGVLAQHAEEGLRRADKNWPKSPEAVRKRLDRARTNLRKVGIEITHHRAKDRGRDRLITISTSTVPGSGGDRPDRPDRPKQASQSHGGADGSDSSDSSDAPFKGPKKTNGAAAESPVVNQPKGRPGARGRPTKKSEPAAGDPSHLSRIKFNKKAPNETLT